MFPRHEVTNFPIYKSDHASICLQTSTNGNCDRYGKLFKLKAMWLSQEDCWKVVEEAWNDSMSMEAPSKLEWCASKLTEWAAATFGKIKNRIREAEKELKKLQDTRPDHNMLSRCEYLEYAAKVFHKPNNSVQWSPPNAWLPPPMGIMKINTDAHVLQGVKVGLGVVIRDNRGATRAAAVKTLKPRSVEIAKVEAVRYGLELARRLNNDKVVVEVDASTVFHAVKFPIKGFSPIYTIYDDIHVTKLYFSYFDVSIVRRSANALAHYIARWNVVECNELVWLEPFPQSFRTIVELDFKSD
ncbi:hypothetical protein RDABS01_032980 [Bienertia sinuspersici]